jgi:Ala-tRNA(Pro) deacylase
MATPQWIKNMLAVRGIAYEELHHPEAFTAQEVAHEEHVSGHRVAKVVVVLADGRPVELVLPASRHVTLERVRELLGAREVRLATEAEMSQFFTDSEPGAIPALRHWEGVDVLMDASMDVGGDIVLQAGTHADAVRLRFGDWFKIVAPRVETFTTPAVCCRSPHPTGPAAPAPAPLGDRMPHRDMDTQC